MDDSDGDGVYTITLSVGAGAQEYKFLGNGDWGRELDGSEPCTTAPGEYVNRVVLVEGPTVVETVCFNSCSACARRGTRLHRCDCQQLQRGRNHR